MKEMCRKEVKNREKEILFIQLEKYSFESFQLCFRYFCMDYKQKDEQKKYLEYTPGHGVLQTEVKKEGNQ